MTEREPTARATVFGAPDQDEIIARIDSVDDDDLSSSFFESSMQDVENAAVRMFDIGIRTITDDAAMGSARAFVAAPSGVPAPTAASAATHRGAPGAGGRFEDPAVRSAFVLGGPRAIAA